jgi:hypothetical protein
MASVPRFGQKEEHDQSARLPRYHPERRKRPALRRGVKMLTINRDGELFTYAQPGWWASIDDPTDDEGPTDRQRLLADTDLAHAEAARIWASCVSRNTATALQVPPAGRCAG